MSWNSWPFLVTNKYLRHLRILRFLMKTLIEINNETWGQVKYYATIKELSINNAVKLLLETALKMQEISLNSKRLIIKWVLYLSILKVGNVENITIINFQIYGAD